MHIDELQRLVDESALHRQLELRVVSVEASSLTVEARVDDIHLASAEVDIVHGGVVATLLDAVVTFALIHVTTEDWATVDLRIDFLRAVPSGPLLAHGSAEYVGSRVGRASGVLTDVTSSREYARAIGTFVRSGAPLQGAR